MPVHGKFLGKQLGVTHIECISHYPTHGLGDVSHTAVKVKVKVYPNFHFS